MRELKEIKVVLKYVDKDTGKEEIVKKIIVPDSYTEELIVSDEVLKADEESFKFEKEINPHLFKPFLSDGSPNEKFLNGYRVRNLKVDDGKTLGIISGFRKAGSKTSNDGKYYFYVKFRKPKGNKVSSNWWLTSKKTKCNEDIIISNTAINKFLHGIDFSVK
jgi:hypothetical protein